MSLGEATKTEGGNNKPTSQMSHYHKAEVRKGTKDESGGGVTGQSDKMRQVVDPGADLIGQRAVFKTELPHLAGGGADQTELQLKENAVPTW
jgi:hypothetical protein